MTGKKGAEVEVRTIGEELKLAKPADILHTLKTIKGWKEKIATLNSHLSTAYKTAKAAKISKKTVDFLLGLERGDPVEYRAEMETIGVGLKAVGAPFQLNVFDIAYANDIEQAKAEGRACAQSGRGFECRFSEGSEAHTAGMTEWMRINAERVPGAENLGEDEIEDAIRSTSHTGQPLEMAHH
ncbi:MAG TPA: hypothetical protein DEQ40_09125 [Oxalobacteraceae bacterium]|nr:hypothetical protein [Oxalobacteraceae bacterium]